MLEGHARFGDGLVEHTVGPGGVVIVPPDQPHTSVNPGPGPLPQIDVHLSGRFVTRWLDEASRP